MPAKGSHRVGWMSLGTRTKRRGQRVTKKYAKRYPHLVKQVFSKPKPIKPEIEPEAPIEIEETEKRKVRDLFNDYQQQNLSLTLNFNVRKRVAALRGRPKEYIVILDYAGKETARSHKYKRLGFIVNVETGRITNVSAQTLTEFLLGEQADNE